MSEERVYYSSFQYLPRVLCTAAYSLPPKSEHEILSGNYSEVVLFRVRKDTHLDQLCFN